MKKFLLILGIILGVILLVIILAVLLTPWMDKWRTTPEERAMGFPGDDLLANPARVANRAVTIQASADKIYPSICKLALTNPACTATPGWKTWWAARWPKTR